ncbi:MAG: hypothetical protein FH748_09555 [Balneolaceae bacterium]|nr:hypothetical protein [Balneolaceae bacterium]
MIQIKGTDFHSFVSKTWPYVIKWWFSVVCIPFCWVLAHQYWMALKWEISFAWMYDYPFFLAPFFFFIDNFLLIVHEAGHTFFGLFGNRFLTIVGGTLLEILLPFGIFVYGWIAARRYTTQLGLLLTAFAWIESSAYAADALERRLPLIGNLPKSAHDFYNLFTRSGVLESHQEIAWGMYWVGILLLFIFLAWPVLETQKADYVDLKVDV